MIKAECDRCGKQKETGGSEKASISVMLPPPFSVVQPRLPEGWRRIVIPAEEEAVQGERKELCAECVNALREFLAGPLVISQHTIMRPECLAGQHESLPGGGPECRYCGASPFLVKDTMAARLLAGETAVGGSCDGCSHAPHAAGKCSVVWMSERCECDEPLETKGCVGHGGPDCVCGDPRPNLTERARKLSTGDRSKRCTCSGVGFGTEDCVPHHPDGLERGTHLKCYRNETGDTAGECPGIYRRGMFPEHMERWHGLKVAEGTKPCPYCTHTERYITELGQHIAADHPGDWQAWFDGGQKAG